MFRQRTYARQCHVRVGATGGSTKPADWQPSWRSASGSCPEKRRYPTSFRVVRHVRRVIFGSTGPSPLGHRGVPAFQEHTDGGIAARLAYRCGRPMVCVIGPGFGAGRTDSSSTIASRQTRRYDVRLGDLDRNLLGELQNWCWPHPQEVGAALGIPPDLAEERIRLLQQHGVIRGFHADVDLAAIERPVQALIAVRIRASVDQAMEHFYAWATKAREMINLYVTSGVSDFMLHIAVPTTQDLYSFVAGELGKHPMVLETRTSLLFEHVRARAVAPFDGAETSRHSRTYEPVGPDRSEPAAENGQF